MFLEYGAAPKTSDVGGGNGYGNVPAPTQPPPPAPAPSYPEESAVDTSQDAQNRNKAGGSKNLQFPLPQCYVNADGFMCCNKELEQLMDNTYRNLSESRNGKWKKCL